MTTDSDKNTQSEHSTIKQFKDLIPMFQEVPTEVINKRNFFFELVEELGDAKLPIIEYNQDDEYFDIAWDGIIMVINTQNVAIVSLTATMNRLQFNIELERDKNGLINILRKQECK